MKRPKFDYDKKADVLYITFGKVEACRSIQVGPGIVVRYTTDNRLNGITIVSFSKRTSSKKPNLNEIHENIKI